MIDPTDVLAPTTETKTTERLFVCSQRNETYEDPKYGTLRTKMRSGGAPVTDENIVQYRAYAEQERARLGEGYTVRVAIETVVETVEVTWREV